MKDLKQDFRDPGRTIRSSEKLCMNKREKINEEIENINQKEILDVKS